MDWKWIGQFPIQSEASKGDGKSMSKRQIGCRPEALLAVIIIFCTAVSFAEDSPLGNISKGKLLYEEDFSTSKISSLECYADANFSRCYQNGSYEMIVNNTNSWRPVTLGKENGDIILEVEATPKAGPDDNLYGVLVRRIDWDNYYEFFVSGDGYYRIAKLKNDSWVTPQELKDWKESSAIKKGKATNLITVVSNGDKFSFYVNDVLLTEFTDSDFPSGTFGIVVGTMFTPGAVTVDFDNFKIWEIEK
jgi:hypothetical protein